MKSGIVFDLDETLIDRRATLEAYAHRFWRDFDVGRDARQSDFVASFLDLDRNGCTPLPELGARLVQRYPRCGLDAATITGHFSEFAWAQPGMAAGVADTLAKLRGAGIPLGIVTNGGADSQRRKLRLTGLERLVHHCLVSGEFGVEKPDSAIFLAMCSALRIAASASWFIGDHPVFDIWGANRVGFRTIWLEKRIPWPEDYERCYTHVVPHVGAALELV